MRFRYSALTESGAPIEEFIEAEDEFDAQAKIRQLGHFATQISLDSETQPTATSRESQVAFEAVQVGGRIISDYYERGTNIRSKGSNETYNLVSDADLESEKAIARTIKSHFPDHEILGEEEEQGSIEAEHLWIIDPLDGTNNFAHRIPHFAVSIAYYHLGQPKCGVVFNPIRGECYWAEQGRGAFERGRRLTVQSATELNQVMVGVGFYYDRGAMMQATLAAVHDFFKQNIHGIRRFGTAALDICQVADGLYGAFFEYQLAPWDVAAARLILQEAGGLITDGQGSQLPLCKSSVLASNGSLHPAALEIVAKHHP